MEQGSTPEEVKRLRALWEKATANPRPLPPGHPHVVMTNSDPRPKVSTWALRRAQLKEIEKEHLAHFHKKWAKLLCPVS